MNENIIENTQEPHVELRTGYNETLEARKLELDHNKEKNSEQLSHQFKKMRWERLTSTESYAFYIVMTVLVLSIIIYLMDINNTFFKEYTYPLLMAYLGYTLGKGSKKE